MQTISLSLHGKLPSARCRSLVIGVLAIVGSSSSLSAQTTFSIEYTNPTIAMPNSFNFMPITEGDILAPATKDLYPALGPLPTPGIFITGGPGGLGLFRHPPCVGHPPGVPCGVEVDALSYGTDGPARSVGMPAGSWKFSVDRFAVGIPGTPFPPALWTEAPPVAEAAADTFVDLGLPPGPLPPFAAGPANTAVIDGNGLAGPSAFAYPGVGLIEPIFPACTPVDIGDNVDALDADGPLAAGPVVYFSLDAAFVDPLCGIPWSGSAVANGFQPGDVLVTSFLIGVPSVYAPAVLIGLDRIGGPGSDDLDALALFENGIPGYQLSDVPYCWEGGADMLIFSVRRGSAVVGAPDSIFGIPIEPGDLLIPPVMGGLSPFPGIFIAAENLGLATSRSTGIPFGDELDALDVTRLAVFDCNQNGLEDMVDIALGLSYDCNANLVPDDCECVPTVYCTAKVNSQGCLPAIRYSGFASVACVHPFDINAINILNKKFGLLFYSLAGAQAVPFQGGWLCMRLPIRRTAVQNSGGSPPPPLDCTGEFHYDFNARIDSGVDPALVQGTQVWAQYWYRDPGYPPPNHSGLTDAIDFVICP